MANIKTRIALRNDDLSNWNSKSDFDLLKGEVALARLSGELSDKYEVRIGVGDKKWQELSASNIVLSAENILDLSNYISKNSPKSKFLSAETKDALDALSAEATHGSIGVVEETISDQIFRTGYYWDTTITSETNPTGTWCQMDGNYKASDVYFTDNMTYTVAIGSLSKPSGLGSFKTAGKSLESVLSSLLNKETAGYISQQPNASTPKLSYTLYENDAVSSAIQSGTSSITADIDSVEYGSVISGITVGNSTFTIPKYSNGPDTGVSVSSTVTKTNGGDAEQTTNGGTLSGVVIGDTGTTYVYGDKTWKVVSELTATVTIKYSAASAEANTNFGNTNTAAGFTKVIISSGSKDGTTAKISGYRACFWGYKLYSDTQLDFTNLTSDDIRSLTWNGKEIPANMTTPEGAKQFIFAAPAGKYTGTMSVTDGNAQNATVTFTKAASAVNVNGANGYTAIAYDIWTYTAGSSTGSAAVKSLDVEWK